MSSVVGHTRCANGGTPVFGRGNSPRQTERDVAMVKLVATLANGIMIETEYAYPIEIAVRLCIELRGRKIKNTKIVYVTVSNKDMELIEMTVDEIEITIDKALE